MSDTTGTTNQRPEGQIDVRAPRVNAAFTAALLLVGIFLAATGSSTGGGAGPLAELSLAQRASDAGAVVLFAVALLFAWSLVSSRTQPLSVIFRTVVQPRLSPPSEWEDERPPRFAQGVGLVVVGVGLALHLIGVPWALVIAGAAAFVAAFLNAAFGFCLGCELYLLLSRAGLVARARHG